MQLYGYWRSSSSYRVRIALALKGLDYENLPVHLVQGAQNTPDYKARNPQGYVPCLVDGDLTLFQSLSIIDYLDRKYPEPQLIPEDFSERGAVLSFAQVVACDIQPLQNVSVLKHVTRESAEPDSARADWSRYWMAKGFAALEAILAARQQTACCFGDAPSLADVVLIPQMYNAERFALDLAPYPNLTRVTEHCRGLAPFIAAHPDQQPDAQ